MPPAFIVSLPAMDNIVELHTSIDGSISASSDIDGSVFVQLTVNGFQDANGNPITATLLPEPGTFDILVGVAGGRGNTPSFRDFSPHRETTPPVLFRRNEGKTPSFHTGGGSF
jgi:hypothetical protein